MPTRYLWLPAQVFSSAAGASGPSAVGSDTDPLTKMAAYAFPNSESVITTDFILPPDWQTGTAVNVTYHWTKAPFSPSTGAVNWDWAWALIIAGNQIDEAENGILSASPLGAGAVEALARTTIGTGFAGGVTPYRTFRGAVRRRSGPFAGNAWLIGVELAYTAG